MKRIKWGHLIVIIIVIILSLISIFYYGKNVKFGLDLRGGVHLVLQASQIIETEETASTNSEDTTKKEGEVQTAQEEQPQESEQSPEEQKTSQEEQPETTESTRKITAADLEKTKSVIEKRINALGVSEVLVTISGNDRIIVDIPGYTNIEEAKNIIGRIAVLTFKDEEGNVLITGKNLKNATFSYQATSEGGVREPVVVLEWDEEGKRLFAEATEKNVGKKIAIYLDEEELMAPTVNEPIKDGNAVITFGGGTIEEKTRQAQEYAALLRGGSLPVKMEFVEERVVGPSLGRDTINKTQVGAILAVILIMAYLIIIYRMFGVIGSVALLAYVVIYLGFLLAIGTVFSLPSIGAVILSFGMAVDSNIIVFERIKEEYKKGRTLRSAVGSGYSHGITAILDSNLSMLLGMAVLWYYGTVQIKGFSLTLIAGIVAALVTSLFFTRFILDTLSIYTQTVNEKLFGLSSYKES